MLALGEKIVKELGLEDTDTLCRWMAHYIAELLEQARTAAGEQRTIKMAECAQAILEIWAHRADFPDGKRPFQDCEPILQVMRSLDIFGANPRYFQRAWRSIETFEEKLKTEPWLRVALALDDAAKVLIRYSLGAAAELSLEKSREWLVLADALSQEDQADLPLIHVILEGVDTPSEEDAICEKVQQIEGMLKKLDVFEACAKEIRTSLEQERQSYLEKDDPGAC